MTAEEEVKGYIARAMVMLTEYPGPGLYLPQQMQVLVVALMLQLADKRGFR
jgi:hypothetical protein